MFKNIINVLPIIHPNKSKMMEKLGSAWFNCKLYQLSAGYLGIIISGTV